MGWRDTIRPIDGGEITPPVPTKSWRDSIRPIEPEVSQLESGIRGFAQGATLDFSDEITGLAESIFTNKTYEQARDESRLKYKAAEEANPLTYNASEIAGGVATAFVPGLGAVGGVAKGATLAAKVGTGVVSGAVQGGLQGLGEAEGSADIQMKNALTSAGIGGAFGGAFGGLFHGVEKAAGVIAKKAEPWVDLNKAISENANISKLQRKVDLNKQAGKPVSEAITDVERSLELLREPPSIGGKSLVFKAAGKNTDELIDEAKRVIDEHDILRNKAMDAVQDTKLIRGAFAEASDSLKMKRDQLIANEVQLMPDERRLILERYNDAIAKLDDKAKNATDLKELNKFRKQYENQKTEKMFIEGSKANKQILTDVGTSSREAMNNVFNKIDPENANVFNELGKREHYAIKLEDYLIDRKASDKPKEFISLSTGGVGYIGGSIGGIPGAITSIAVKKGLDYLASPAGKLFVANMVNAVGESNFTKSMNSPALKAIFDLNVSDKLKASMIRKIAAEGGKSDEQRNGDM